MNEALNNAKLSVKCRDAALMAFAIVITLGALVCFVLIRHPFSQIEQNSSNHPVNPKVLLNLLRGLRVPVFMVLPTLVLAMLYVGNILIKIRKALKS